MSAPRPPREVIARGAPAVRVPARSRRAPQPGTRFEAPDEKVAVEHALLGPKSVDESADAERAWTSEQCESAFHAGVVCREDIEPSQWQAVECWTA